MELAVDSGIEIWRCSLGDQEVGRKLLVLEIEEVLDFCELDLAADGGWYDNKVTSKFWLEK